MKLAAFSAALLAMTAAPVFAQTATPTPAPAPTAAAPAASAAADAATPKFTLDTPIETIAADPAGKAVLDADLPGLTAHPAYEQFKGMSLAAVQPMSQGALSDAALAKTKADLAALK